MALTVLSFVKSIKLGEHLALNLSANPKGVGASASVKVAGVNVNIGKKGKTGGVGVKRVSTSVAGFRVTKRVGQGKKKSSQSEANAPTGLLESLASLI